MPGVAVPETGELFPLGPTERTEKVYGFPLVSPLIQQLIKLSLVSLSELQVPPPGSAVTT
jgi:hypothetical protein